MATQRRHVNSFQSGVLSPNTLGRSDTTLYANGLREGKNIVIDPMGGVSRRAGSKFIKDFGSVEHVRLFPFTFNKDQSYLVVMTIESPTTTVIDIYRDDLIVAEDIIVPYNTADMIKEIDIAQSADTMIMSQGDTAPYMLIRKGSDSAWAFIPVPIVNPPLYDPNDTGIPDTPLWSKENGYPKYCTFHQGRLWFAGNFIRPQSVWSSVTHDFFNFDLGAGDSADSIQESLDTDFINPITSIFSARKLQVFTRGDEFYNDYQGALTPLSSSWARQTNYGSAYFIPPLAVDGATMYVDATGRTIRNFVYSDEKGGYSAPSISSQAEHLIKEPQRMGVLRGNITRSYNLVYIVNSDGTMAVLTLSTAHQTLAWAEWTTQGEYSDISVVDRDAYILVKRLVQPIGEYVTYDNNIVTDGGELVWTGDNPAVVATAWILERIDETLLLDSSSIKESISETTDLTFNKSHDDFFATYTSPDGEGYVFIVRAGILVYSSIDIVVEPLKAFTDDSGVRFSAGDLFSYNDDIREKYVTRELSYTWGMYTLLTVQTVDVGTNYIDNLAHHLGLEVLSVLDGNVQDPQIVVNGDSVVTVERSYPDGEGWLYDDNNQVVETENDNLIVDTTISYDGTDYVNPSLTEYGYLISGVDGEPNSTYLQKGIVMESPITNWNDEVFNSNGTFIPAPFETEVTVCMVGGGGSGSSRGSAGTLSVGGGFAGQAISKSVSISTSTAIIVGTGGASVVNANGLSGNSSMFGTITAVGGDGGVQLVGSVSSGYMGNGASKDSCGGSFKDGLSQNDSGSIAYGGESSGFGDGGNGGVSSGTGGQGTAGGVGAGGGGSGTLHTSNAGKPSGAGGKGQVRVSHTVKTTQIIKSEVRKMVLIEVTVAGGVITFPTANYHHAQAGLYFPVRVQTMPLMINKGSGNYGNEPKRIVSITSRYEKTQGVEVNGISVPERVFSERTLDESPPLISGIDKNRHLGYNRETSVTISQDDPMPFTLLSIDIELNQ